MYNKDDAHPYLKYFTIKIKLVVTAHTAAIKAMENMKIPRISLHLNFPKSS